MGSFQAIEGFSKCYGVNTHSPLPTDADKFFMLSRAVNRSTFSMLNGTRPPFEEIPLKFQSTEEEYTFRNAAITGMKFYAGEAKLFSSFLIIAVGDRVIAGYIKANSIEFFTIYKGIDPEWIYSFFGKALNILTLNNGVTPGIFWTGDISKPMKFIYESTYAAGSPMPVSNLSVFGHGRFHVGTKEGLVYSGDYVTSAGLQLVDREKVLSFKESEYPSSGDGFGAPAEMGTITAMKLMAKSDQINGHGDLMVGCSTGFFSISPGDKVRSDWTNDPSMQKIVFDGKGCCAHSSIITWGNQVYYRDSNNDISSLNLDIAAYQRQVPFTNISTPIEVYTDYDNDSSDVQQCVSFTTADRLVMTIGHMRERSSHMGTHRYANGMVSACRQKRENGDALSWEGLWTGPRVVEACQTSVGGYIKTIVASFDTDKQNRLYFINESRRGDDYRLGDYKPIRSKFSYSSIFFDSAQNTPLVKKKLGKIDILMIRSNLKGLKAAYSTSGTSELFDIEFQSTEITGCGLTTSRSLSRDINGEKSLTSPRRSNEGYYFTVHIEIEGVGEVAKAVMGGNIVSGDGFEVMNCEKQQTDTFTTCFTKGQCNELLNDFSYQF